MVSYDRVFEEKNLANEMVSGENRQMTFFEVLTKVYNQKDGHLGSCYVKYLEPIKVKEFLDKNNFESQTLVQAQKEPAALKLTETLLRA